MHRCFTIKIYNKLVVARVWRGDVETFVNRFINGGWMFKQGCIANMLPIEIGLLYWIWNLSFQSLWQLKSSAVHRHFCIQFYMKLALTYCLRELVGTFDESLVNRFLKNKGILKPVWSNRAALLAFYLLKSAPFIGYRFFTIAFYNKLVLARCWREWWARNN